MKKIIAAAVTSAFMAPAFAADITLSGDIEMRYVMSSGDGMYAEYDDADIRVTASEELGNGMSITAFVEVLDGVDVDGTASDGADVEMYISGSFGTVGMGTIDHAGQRVDELASPADIDGGDGNMAANGTAATANTINWLLPSMVEGLTANVSYSLQDNDASGATDNEVDASAVGLQYTTGGLTLAYAQQDEEGEAFTTTYTGVRYSVAGLSIGVDQATDKTADGDKHTTLGASYAVTGDTTVYVEANDIEDSAADEDTDIIGLLYNVGGGLNVRVENIDSSTAANDETTIAILYAF